MNIALTYVLAALVLLGGCAGPAQAQWEDKVKVEIESVGLHPGMEPGMYVCALGHLHIKGTVQNVSRVALGRVEVRGKAFDADGKLLGAAAASTKPPVLNPGAKADINLEFLTVTGPLIEQAKKHEVTVVKAPVSQ